MKINTKKVNVLTAIFLCIPILCNSNHHDKMYANNFEKELGQKSKETKLEFIFPINVIKKPLINLIVGIPENFYMAYSPDPNFREFIPKTDKDVSSWSAIITTNTYIGKGMKAAQKAEFVKQIISQGGSNVKILDSTVQNNKDYSVARFLISYSHKGRQEVVLGKYYSGPYDCSGYQYTIALSKNMTEADALKKIQEFEKNSTCLLAVTNDNDWKVIE